MSCAYRYSDGSRCQMTEDEHGPRPANLDWAHAFVEPAPQAECGFRKCIPGMATHHHECPWHSRSAVGARPAQPDPDAAARAIADDMIESARIELGPRGKRLVL